MNRSRNFQGPADAPATAELARVREDHECAAAHADDPAAALWIDAVGGDAEAVEAVLGTSDPKQPEAARELLAPLEPAAHARLVDELTMRHVAGRPAIDPPIAAAAPVVSPRPRARKWWIAVPVAAAAAVVLGLLGTLGGDSGEFDGEVRVTPAMRNSVGGDGRSLVIRQHAWLYLDCGAPDPAREVMGVTATSVETGTRALLRAEPPKDDSHSWHVLVDLSTGRWTVDCNVFDRGLARPLRLEPAALDVRP